MKLNLKKDRTLVNIATCILVPLLRRYVGKSERTIKTIRGASLCHSDSDAMLLDVLLSYSGRRCHRDRGRGLRCRHEESQRHKNIRIQDPGNPDAPPEGGSQS